MSLYPTIDPNLNVEGNVFNLIKLSNSDFGQTVAEDWLFTDFKPNENPSIDREYQVNVSGITSRNTAGNWTFYYNRIDLNKIDFSLGTLYRGPIVDYSPVIPGDYYGITLDMNTPDYTIRKWLMFIVGIHNLTLKERIRLENRATQFTFTVPEGLQDLYKGELVFQTR